MRHKALILAALLPLAACGSGTTTMQFYPLQGAIATADPSLVIEATMRNVNGTSGPVSFRLPDRNDCDGTWSSLTPKTVSRSGGLSLTWKKVGGDVGSQDRHGGRRERRRDLRGLRGWHAGAGHLRHRVRHRQRHGFGD